MINPMKDSGVEWIGKIPSDWVINKLGFLGSLQNGISKSGDEFGFGLPFVSYGDVYNNFQLPSIPSGLVNSTKNDRLLYSVKRGDVFFTRTSETADEIGIASTNLNDILDATFSGFLIRFRPRRGILEPSFSKYYFRSDIGKLFMVGEMNLVTRASLGQNLLKKYPVLLPPIQEQLVIANFLDEETKKLDDAKSLLQQQIEKLKEYRKSLIWETVTKGLDKTVPMKDSGVDWIGEIPEGWEVNKIKYTSSADDEQVKTQDISSGKKIRYVDIGSVNLTDGVTDYQEMSLLDAPSRARKIVRIGDTIVSTVRTYLKAIAYIQDEENVVVSTGFSVLRPKELDSKFFNYCIMSDSFTEQVENVAWGIAYPSISNSNLMNLKISYPKDVWEQQAIAYFLEEKTSVIEKILSNKQTQIQLIDKQKKTLIYDYVTGKRRVKL